MLAAGSMHCRARLWTERVRARPGRPGGEKQRLAVARVLLKDPPILFFDEAVSCFALSMSIRSHQPTDLRTGRVD